MTLLNDIESDNADCHDFTSDLESAHGSLVNYFTTERVVVVCWLLNVPATCECISGTDLLRQFYVLPH